MHWLQHVFFIVAVLIVALIGLHVAYAHGPAEWIMENPSMGWCCSEKDCLPAEGRVTFENDGYYHVEGLQGRMREGDSGFFRLSHVDRPWVCAMPGTFTLRCLIMPGAGG